MKRVHRGLRDGIFLFCLLGGIHFSHGGPPFITDDPGTPPKGGWQVYTNIVYERDSGQKALTAPFFSLSYSLTDQFQWTAAFAQQFNMPDKGDGHSGLTDTDLSLKWRPIDEDPKGLRPAVAFVPHLSVPTGSESRGIGDHIWRTRLPIQFAKTFGNCYVYTELGYACALSDHADDAVYGGICAQYQLTEKWNIGAEINATHTLNSIDEDQLIATVGAIYSLNDHVQLQFDVGRTLRDPDLGGPKLLVLFNIQLNF